MADDYRCRGGSGTFYSVDVGRIGCCHGVLHIVCLVWCRQGNQVAEQYQYGALVCAAGLLRDIWLNRICTEDPGLRCV